MRSSRTVIVSRRDAVRALTLFAAAAVVRPTRLLAAPVRRLVVYKDASCSCCEPWAEHLRAAGWTIEVHTDATHAALQQRKDRLGVPTAVRSCHTALVSSSSTPSRGRTTQYLIEGHVPLLAIERLLQERPAVDGLAVPGMPSGTYGMELPLDMPADASYAVVAFTAAGDTREFGRYPTVRRATAR